MKTTIIVVLLLLVATQSYSAEPNNRVQATISFDEMEYHVDDESVAWASTFSLGTDTHQFNVVSEGEHACDGLDGHELRAYYSGALSSKVGINLGWRGDLNPGPRQDWMLVGISWAAPFNLETETSLFVGSGGRKGLRLEVKRVCQIVPTLTLTPELKANFHSENDIRTGTGSGLSELEIGLRLAFEVTAGFSPYIGIAWAKPYGKTAEFARTEGGHEGNAQLLLGFSFLL